jgi:hypothetical protein
LQPVECESVRGCRCRRTTTRNCFAPARSVPASPTNHDTRIKHTTNGDSSLQDGLGRQKAHTYICTCASLAAATVILSQPKQATLHFFFRPECAAQIVRRKTTVWAHGLSVVPVSLATSRVPQSLATSLHPSYSNCFRFCEHIHTKQRTRWRAVSCRGGP